MNNKLSILEEKIKATCNPEAFSAELNKGLEQAAEGSKISMRVIAKQNELFLNAFAKAMSGALMPNPFGFALGGPALEDCFAMQKEMMAKAMEQGTAVMEAIQEAGTKATSEFTSMVQQTLPTAQKEIKEITESPLKPSSSKVQTIR